MLRSLISGILVRALIHPFSRNHPDDNSESPVSFDDMLENIQPARHVYRQERLQKKISGALKYSYAIRSQIISSGSKLGRTVSRITLLATRQRMTMFLSKECLRNGPRQWTQVTSRSGMCSKSALFPCLPKTISQMTSGHGALRMRAFSFASCP